MISDLYYGCYELFISADRFLPTAAIQPGYTERRFPPTLRLMEIMWPTVPPKLLPELSS